MNNYYTSKGYYVIGENIYNVEAFTNNHKETIDEIMEWANKEDVFVEFGCLKNGQAYCRYLSCLLLPAALLYRHRVFPGACPGWL